MSSDSSALEAEERSTNFVAACTILAGPNGSGKSSIYRTIDPPGEFVNADVIARGIDPANPEAASLAAGRAVLNRLRELVAQRTDFTYETTLSSRQAITLMRDAREAGFQVGLVFVTLASADLNVRRVADRVSKGGHAIPEETIRRRYDVSLARLAEALPLTHASALFDNSEPDTRLLLRMAGLVIEENHLDESRELHRRISGVVSDVLGLNVTDVLRAGRTDASVPGSI